MNFNRFRKHEGVAAPMMRNDLEVEFIASPLNSTWSSHTLHDVKLHVHGVQLHGVDRNHKHAFSAERYFPDGSENPSFILNKPPYRNASILLMGENFGVGSMQLMASIQLLQCGVKAVIAISFGPTFYEDSVAVGLLPIELKAEALCRLQRATEQSPGSTITIDLEKMHIHHKATGTIAIEMNEKVRSRFLHGSTDMDVLSKYKERTDKVIAERKQQRPWLE